MKIRSFVNTWDSRPECQGLGRGAGRGPLAPPTPGPLCGEVLSGGPRGCWSSTRPGAARPGGAREPLAPQGSGLQRAVRSPGGVADGTWGHPVVTVQLLQRGWRRACSWEVGARLGVRTSEAPSRTGSRSGRRLLTCPELQRVSAESAAAGAHRSERQGLAVFAGRWEVGVTSQKPGGGRLPPPTHQPAGGTVAW